MKREDFKAIKINIISNALWQIFLSLFMSLSIAKKIVSQISSILEEYEISNTVVTILIFIVIETLVVFLIIFFLTKKNVKNKDNKSDNNTKENNNDFEKVCEKVVVDDNNESLDTDYYFEDYTKHVTIYKNGNGIIMNTFNIVVNNCENFREFKRKINVEDGKKDIEFPSLKKMKEVNKDKRFKDFGFWVYKPSDSIVNSTIERYWSDNDPDEIDHVSERNPKELRWVFEINRSQANTNRLHKVAYAISIPGLYPIQKGQFVKEIANDPDMNGKASSSIHVEHYIKKITYILSFEDGIKLDKQPECFTINGKRIPIYDFYLEEGVFYNKYIFSINKPSYGTNIVIKWKFKGGNKMDKEAGD